MSKNSSSKNEERKHDNIDSQTNLKMLTYTINIKEAEIEQQKTYIEELTAKMTHLEKEHSELKANYIQTFKTEKTIKQMQILLEQEQRNVERSKEEARIKTKEYKEEKEELIKKYESELFSLRNMMEQHQKKMENVYNLQNLVEKQEEEIKHLSQQKETILKECENNMRNKDIKNQIKFTDLKKKMMTSIQETQKNVTELNIEYMDVSTKLTLLQNHQLLIEIQYQSEQIEELLKKKEFFEKKVFELNKDLEVHREVELSLAEKNKQYSEKIKFLEKKLKMLPSNSITIKDDLYQSMNLNSMILDKSEESLKGTKSVQINSSLKEFSLSSNLEKKILKLENVLKRKQEEIKKMRDNYQIIEDKLKSYDAKLSKFTFLLEEGSKLFSEDESLMKGQDVNNLEKIRKGKFENLSKEEKIFVIETALKNIIPLLDFTDSKNNFKESHLKSNSVVIKKHLDDPVMKMVFSSKNSNMIYSIKRGLEKLPIIIK